jgi:hypothetical protein
MTSWPVFKNFKWMLGQKNTLIPALRVRQFWKPFRLPNNASIGTKMSKGVAWYLYPAHIGSVLSPWTCWGKQKRNHQQTRKRLFCSKVCRTCAIPGGL